MPPRAVLFDLDNTLHDRDAGVAAFLRTQHAALDLPIPFEAWRARFVALERRGRVWKDVVYRDLVAGFGLDHDPAALLADYEAGFAGHVVPFGNPRETLRTLRERGWRTGIVSNGRAAFQRATLGALGIDDLIDTVIISAEVDLRKPDPAIFRLALDRLGCEAGASWFVGDDPEADVAGARGVGMQALWFQPGEPEAVGRLADIPRLVGPS